MSNARLERRIEKLKRIVDNPKQYGLVQCEVIRVVESLNALIEAKENRVRAILGGAKC